MSDFLELGTVSIVAVMSFMFGRFWSNTEEVFANRQRAYAEFSRKCILVSELLLTKSEQELEALVPILREAGAEFVLYGSTEANDLAGRYLGKLGFIMAAGDFEAETVTKEIKEAEAIYGRLQKEMRRDALGWTWFGLRERVGARLKKKREKDSRSGGHE